MKVVMPIKYLISAAHNKNQYVYNSTEYNNHEDNVTYTLTIFYDEKAKVKSISVETFYHEDC